MVIDERTELVAKTITDYLKRTNPMDKTIIFCNDIDHAERMRRALVNLNPEQVKKNDKYVMKITGDDDIGKAQLDNFINPKSLSGYRHHLRTDDHRRGCQNLQTGGVGPKHSVDDQIQANHRPRHPHR